jgi:hypothetical protein
MRKNLLQMSAEGFFCLIPEKTDEYNCFFHILVVSLKYITKIVYYITNRKAQG